MTEREGSRRCLVLGTLSITLISTEDVTYLVSGSPPTYRVEPVFSDIGTGP